MNNWCFFFVLLYHTLSNFVYYFVCESVTLLNDMGICGECCQYIKKKVPIFYRNFVHCVPICGHCSLVLRLTSPQSDDGMAYHWL
ncbi:hypothetical protein BC01_112 [Bacillus phage BC01]|nr:hypothetical protein BC01_112 [Bacillus phage BC01]